mmetsp:Transcript_38901/g.93155  ORF Transcript_38901/g.93155 Transcript_38901/m.93155 type:complete len:235 (+) Transcript_38901:14-718(+)
MSYPSYYSMSKSILSAPSPSLGALACRAPVAAVCRGWLVVRVTVDALRPPPPSIVLLALPRRGCVRGRECGLGVVHLGPRRARAGRDASCRRFLPGFRLGRLFVRVFIDLLNVVVRVLRLLRRASSRGGALSGRLRHTREFDRVIVVVGISGPFLALGCRGLLPGRGGALLLGRLLLTVTHAVVIGLLACLSATSRFGGSLFRGGDARRFLFGRRRVFQFLVVTVEDRIVYLRR